MGSGLANLVLRDRRRGARFLSPPQQAADANRDATDDISAGGGEEHGLRPLPDKKCHAADEQDDKRRMWFRDTDLLKTRITPGADHEQTDDTDGDKPSDGYSERADG